jgi:two-component system, chemotaxis family, protein-glutamate methylesterase/glutaminase
MSKKIRVLIIDDSASVRQALTKVLEEDPEIVVMGAASDPFMAAKKIQEELPDVITLDVEMPRMDGITFLRKIMSQRPIPVVMCSSLTEEGSATLMQALEAGARLPRRFRRPHPRGGQGRRHRASRGRPS